MLCPLITSDQTHDVLIYLGAEKFNELNIKQVKTINAVDLNMLDKEFEEPTHYVWYVMTLAVDNNDTIMRTTDEIKNAIEFANSIFFYRISAKDAKKIKDAIYVNIPSQDETDEEDINKHGKIVHMSIISQLVKDENKFMSLAFYENQPEELNRCMKILTLKDQEEKDED